MRKWRVGGEWENSTYNSVVYCIWLRGEARAVGEGGLTLLSN